MRSEGKSDSYLSLVGYCVSSLSRHLASNAMPVRIRDITAWHIRGYLTQLQSAQCFAQHPYARPQKKQLSGHTVNTYGRSLRAFWSWLEGEGIIDDNPFCRVKIPPAPETVIPTLSDDQLRSLFAQIDTKQPQGVRDYAIIALLVDTMVRVSELINCRLVDVDLDRREITVWGKGRKQRVIPFAVTAQKILWKYIKLYRPEPCLQADDRLFLTFDGRPLTKNRVEEIVKKYGNQAGIKGVRLSPHTFRHTGASIFCRNGGDSFSLKRIMGHADIKTSQIYVHHNQEEVNVAHTRASPLDSLGLKQPVTRRKRKSPP
jgi:integrase/recombinase XerD